MLLHQSKEKILQLIHLATIE